MRRLRVKATVVLYSEDKELASQEYTVEQQGECYVNKDIIEFPWLDALVTHFAIYSYGGIRLGVDKLSYPMLFVPGVSPTFQPGALSITLDDPLAHQSYQYPAACAPTRTPGGLACTQLGLPTCDALALSSPSASLPSS